MDSPFNPCLYAWSPHHQNPNLYIRRALGVENRWVLKARTKPPQVLLYLSGELSFKVPITNSEFTARAKQAWMAVRWQHPEICLGPYLSGDDKQGKEAPQMCCPIPSSEEEAAAWADATLKFDLARNSENGTMGKAVAYLRSRVTELKGEHMPPVSLQFAATSGGETWKDGILKGVQYAFCVDHACTDGVGTYLIAGRYFAVLAKYIGGGVDEREVGLDWRRCMENLPEPWLGVMNQEQRTWGVEFEKNVNTIQGKIERFAKCDWGLAIRETGDRYEPTWLYFSFPEDITAAILRACKEKMNISVTHLGHAATVIAAFKGSGQEDLPRNGLTCPLFFNGRRCLDSDSKKPRFYLPMCRAMGFIEFTDAEKLALPKHPTAAETHKALAYACHQAQDSYQRIRDQTSILTESFVGSEYLSLTKNHVRASKAQPFFLSDGLTEQYIQQVYCGVPETREIFSVDEVQFIADPDGPPLVIRISTFRNRLKLSAEWNNACYVEGEAEYFVREIYLLMKSII